MSKFGNQMTFLAEAIKQKNPTVTGKLTVQGMINAVQGISINGDTDTYYKVVSVDTANKTWQGAEVYKNGSLFSFLINYDGDQQWYFTDIEPVITELEDGTASVDFSNAAWKCPWLASDTVIYDSSAQVWIVKFNGVELRSNTVTDPSVPPYNKDIWPYELTAYTIFGEEISAALGNDYITPKACSSYPLVQGTYSGDIPPYTGDGEIFLSNVYNPVYTIDALKTKMKNTLNIGAGRVFTCNGEYDLGGAYYPPGSILRVDVPVESDSLEAVTLTAEYAMEGYTFVDADGKEVDGTALNLTQIPNEAASNISYSEGESYSEVIVKPDISGTAVIDQGTSFAAKVANLIPENVRDGVALGDGDFVGVYKGDYSAVTARPEDVLEDRTFVDAEGVAQSGAMPYAEYVALNGGASGWNITKGYIPEDTKLRFNGDTYSGSYDVVMTSASTVIDTAGTYCDSSFLVTISGLDAAIIKKGETIAGVVGTYEGESSGGDSADLVVSGAPSEYTNWNGNYTMTEEPDESKGSYGVYSNGSFEIYYEVSWSCWAIRPSDDSTYYLFPELTSNSPFGTVTTVKNDTYTDVLTSANIVLSAGQSSGTTDIPQTITVTGGAVGGALDGVTDMAGTYLYEDNAEYGMCWRLDGGGIIIRKIGNNWSFYGETLGGSYIMAGDVVDYPWEVTDWTSGDSVGYISTAPVLSIDGSSGGGSSGGSCATAGNASVIIGIKWSRADGEVLYVPMGPVDTAAAGTSRQWWGYDNYDEDMYRLRYSTSEGAWQLYNQTDLLVEFNMVAEADSDPWDCDWNLAAIQTGYDSAKCVAVDI